MDSNAIPNPLTSFIESTLNDAIAAAIANIQFSHPQPVAGTPITLEEAQKLLKTSKPTLIKLAKSKIIKSYQYPGNKRTYFIKEELVEDLKRYPQY